MARKKIFGLPVLVAVALGVILLGVALFVAGAQFFPRRAVLKATSDQIAGLLIATGLLSILWEAFGKSAFTREVLGYARVAEDVSTAGIRRTTMSYLDEVEWDDLFTHAHNLDIFVAYGRTWRHKHNEQLIRMAGRKNTRIRVFLPDPDDSLHLEVMARRFNRSATRLESDVREALTEFATLGEVTGANVEIYVREGDWLFSCYRFDERAILVLYSHAQVRQSTPTLVVTDGTFADFVEKDIEAILGQSKGVSIPTAQQGRAR